MTTHTPGPFEIDTDRSILCRPQADRYGRDMISDVLPIAGVYSWMGPEEADANARLFGAAPDLLAAAIMLETLEEHWANCESCSADGMESCGVWDALFDDARLKRRAAIAKATGMPLAESRLKRKSKGLAVETKGSI